jgi:hypothetical protein
MFAEICFKYLVRTPRPLSLRGQRLLSLEFDESVPKPFSVRVAKEYGWSRSFARLAIEEYKKFQCLQCTFGMLTPAPIVDQVWQQHLQYTERYWGYFCKEICEQRLERDPRRWSACDIEGSYRETRARYRQTFGGLPPRQFWPTRLPRGLDATINLGAYAAQSTNQAILDCRYGTLWKKISQHQLPALSLLSIQRKLRISELELARLVEEYKRFLLLGVIDGPVTPSLLVDEIWHQHLVFTHDYWQVLCGEILETSFQHSPGNGEAESEAEFQRQFFRTLDKYYYWFEQDPPQDVWGKYQRQ